MVEKSEVKKMHGRWINEKWRELGSFIILTFVCLYSIPTQTLYTQTHLLRTIHLFVLRKRHGERYEGELLDPVPFVLILPT